MDLLKLLYEPYVIIIFISLIITLIAYFIIVNNKKNEEDEETKTDIPKTLLYTFIISLILLVLLKFIVSYMNTNNFFQKGGTVDPIDVLTVVADDVDYDIIE